MEEGRGVDRLGQGVAQSPLVPSPEPLGEHGGEDEVGDGGGEGETPVEPEQVDRLQPGEVGALDVAHKDTGGSWAGRGARGEGFRGTEQWLGGG